MSQRTKLENKRFGKLYVVEYVGKGYYKCKCDCGVIKNIRGSDLKNGFVKSCGCLRRQKGRIKPTYDTLVGRKFGKLTVIKKSDSNKYKQNWWVCKCKCGKEVIVRTAYLTSGRTTSCGECNKFYIHSMSGSAEYNVWKMMLQRCYNPNATNYDYYGGRGITVCK